MDSSPEKVSIHDPPFSAYHFLGAIYIPLFKHTQTMFIQNRTNETIYMLICYTQEIHACQIYLFALYLFINFDRAYLNMYDVIGLTHRPCGSMLSSKFAIRLCIRWFDKYQLHASLDMLCLRIHYAMWFSLKRFYTMLVLNLYAHQYNYVLTCILLYIAG